MDDGRLRGIRVLFVEDSEDDALLVIRQLRTGGLRVEHRRVEDAEGLRAALDQGPWDVVLTDHSMPCFSSLETLRLVKERGLDVPVIIVSGLIGDDVAVDAMWSGAADYVLKSNLSRLLPAIERELRVAARRRSHREAQVMIEQLASYDALTDLLNRNQFEARLRSAMFELEVEPGQLALLYIDVDQLKVINDTCGHAAGDHLLQRLAKVLVRTLGGAGVAGRLGGDEFGVLLEGTSMDRAWRVAQDVLLAVRAFRFLWEDQNLAVSVSVGLAGATTDTARGRDLLRDAELACFAAKERGRNRVHGFVEGDRGLAARRQEMLWVRRVRSALEQGRFVLYQQRILPLQDPSQPGHRELLVRMLDPDGALIPPGEFIPAAERYDLMPEVDRWVLRHAVRYARDHRPAGRLFINVSGASISDPEFVDFLDSELRSAGLGDRAIGFEITETAAVADFAAARAFILRVRQLGCEVALDDFGSGMSSYSYLKSIPVDIVKIDGSFVRNMLNDPMDAVIVESINRIGHVAGARTVAEFVENDAIRQRLRQVGVDYGQGYGIARPEPLLG